MSDLPFAIDRNGRVWGPRDLSWAWLSPRVYAPADVTLTVNGTPLEGDRYTVEMVMGDSDERRKAAAERRRGR